MKQVHRFQTPQYGKIHDIDAQLLSSKLISGWGVIYKVMIYYGTGDDMPEFLHHKEIELEGNFKTIMELRNKKL